VVSGETGSAYLDRMVREGKIRDVELALVVALPGECRDGLDAGDFDGGTGNNSAILIGNCSPDCAASG
jgi:hypothetical protein